MFYVRFQTNQVLLWLFIGSLVIFKSADAIAGDELPLFFNGFEALDKLALNCEVKSYPCTLAEADPDAIARTAALLQELWAVRDAGTLDDVRAYLESQTDVSGIGGNIRFVIFQVDGMMPAVFDDSTVVTGQPAPVTNTTNSKTNVSKSRPMEVVGEDTTPDGAIDQKDSKRALVLAPFEWDFAPDDESETLAVRLEMARGYAGNVVFKRNLNEDDTNISIEDWLSFGNFDAVAISTHGSRNCEILPDLSNDCEVWISSGVEWDFLDRPPLTVIGATVSLTYGDVDDQTPTFGRVTLLKDFWRFHYAGALDNQLVSFSACETGNTEGSELAAIMGNDDFVMTGWTEVVDSDVAFSVALSFYEELAKGVTTDEAFDHVASLGLFPYINSDGLETAFEVFAPQGKPVRLFELPTLLFNGEVIPEGINIAELVDGIPGDQTPDSLELTIQVDGVTPESKPDFMVRYRVNDLEASGSYGLDSATQVNGFENRYEVTHNVSLGFPLPAGQMPLEVIVDLPEGGESLFSTTVEVASCYFAANVSGDKVAFFDGPAQFEIGNDGTTGFTFRSREFINADLSNSVTANFQTAPGSPLAPDTYNLVSGGVSFLQPLYGALYIDGIEDFDCPACGGTVTIDSYDEEQSIAGSMNLTLPRNTPPPEDGQNPVVTLDAEFVAAFGSTLMGTSPYVKCSIQY